MSNPFAWSPGPKPDIVLVIRRLQKAIKAAKERLRRKQKKKHVENK